MNNTPKTVEDLKTALLHVLHRWTIHEPHDSVCLSANEFAAFCEELAEALELRAEERLQK